MLLAIDVGNTNVVMGIFQGEKLRATWRFATDLHKMADEYAVLLLNLFPREGIALSDITDAIMCSVVPPMVTTFEEMCQRYIDTTPLVVGSGIKTGVRICIDNPREVGGDRVVNAAAAHRFYGGPVIVLDFGTATTFDAVSAEGDYLGGVIAPGVNVAAESLFERAAKLPRVEMIAPQKVIGRNTIAAMQAGLIFGYVGLIEGIVARMRAELGGTARVVATGGLTRAIVHQTSVIDAVDPDLTLKGLHLIHELNTRR